MLVEIDKPEDCTLSIEGLSEPQYVGDVSEDVGAILSDPTTEEMLLCRNNW